MSQDTKAKKMKTVFVTVGTTRFDKLVAAATSTMALEWMKSQGYNSLVIQYGTGIEPDIPDQSQSHNNNDDDNVISIQTYRFQPTLMEDMERADLIISHAGAGTVMEAVRLQKILIVVINTDLMDNHQMELATAMAERGHLFVVEEPELLQQYTTWESFQNFVPKSPQQQQQGGDEYDFPRLVDSFLGFNTTLSEPHTKKEL